MSTEDDLARRLATVLFADVVGYTRLSEANESATHRALRESLRLVSDLISEHQGVVAHYAGDAVLAEFPSVISGLDCAVAIQRCMMERNAATAEPPRILFRIGVNVGDVISDEGEIYGDAVNTAVRLQSLAEPGGVCISEAVRNAIGARAPIAYEYLGDERLKNLSFPVRAYRAVLDTEGQVPPEPNTGGKPSVAVMPLENLSDASHDGLVDSFTDDVIRELSRFRGLEVVDHQSTFAYKGKATKTQKLAEELAVEFVVEGQIRFAHERVRLSVELVDARAGHPVWSELYDRHFVDDFTVQDEVVREVVAAIAGRVHAVSSEAALRRSSDELRAFEHVLRGQALVGKGADSNALARAHYQRALALEPGGARALAGSALSLIDDWWNGWTEDPPATLRIAYEAATKAYGADTADSKAHWVLGLIHLLRGEIDQAARLVSRATELNRNDADSFAVQALVSIYRGESVHARQAIATALELNPFPPAWYRWVRGVSHFIDANMTAALYVLLETVQQNPELTVARAYLVAVQVELGDLDAARSEARQLMGQNPGLTAHALIRRLPVTSDAERRRFVGAFTTASIPK